MACVFGVGHGDHPVGFVFGYGVAGAVESGTKVIYGNVAELFVIISHECGPNLVLLVTFVNLSLLLAGGHLFKLLLRLDSKRGLIMPRLRYTFERTREAWHFLQI